MGKKIKLDLKKVKKMASRGLTQAEIAMALGVSSSLVEKRIKNDPEFTAAYEEGKYGGLDEVANALFDEAVGGNVQAAKFYLSARANWSDKVDLTSGGQTLPPVVFNLITES